MSGMNVKESILKNQLLLLRHKRRRIQQQLKELKEKRSRKELKPNKKEVVKNGKRKVVSDFYKIGDASLGNLK